MIHFTVTQAHSVDVPKDTPLLWVLRDQLTSPLTSSAAASLLRACTVHIDGKPAKACAVEWADDREKHHHHRGHPGAVIRSLRTNLAGAGRPSAATATRPAHRAAALLSW